ncbi:MAG TPA: tetratricopeptide repeat protein [Kofleriaceae bacterium]
MSRLGTLILCLAAACGGNAKKEPTTPKAAAGSADQTSMSDKGPVGDGTAAGSAATPATTGTTADTSPQQDPSAPPVQFPNYDPDPAQAKAQVDQHLSVAKQALSAPVPDGDTALREARAALAIDAANVDAAAYVAFAYYHKHLYDTAELVLDDLFRRDAAQKNATVFYVYGLLYDHGNQPERAIAAYKKCLAIDANYASALVNLGVHQLQNSQYTEAQQTFERLTKEFGRQDAITLTSLGSAYRGRAADYPSGSAEHNDYVHKAEATYKRAIQANGNYGPAYYNTGLLYLDNDPYPGVPDALTRIADARQYFDEYKNMPNVDIKLYDERMKDVTKAQKRAEKLAKQKKRKGAE